MPVLTTLKTLAPEDARRAVRAGAAFVDLRAVDEYLQRHIRASLSLLYEAGPGLPSRARDCLPLELPLVLLDRPGVDMRNAAAGLRGKGFSVLGVVTGALEDHSPGAPLATTPVIEQAPPADALLDVGDPGARPPAGALRIPVETLWAELDRVRGVQRVVVAAGFGVRAALAVGMLERAGVQDVQVWRPRGPGGSHS